MTTSHHVSGKVNCHSVRIWDWKFTDCRTSSWFSEGQSVLCGFLEKSLWTFPFRGKHNSGQTYLEMLQRFFPLINKDLENFIFQQVGAQLQWHRNAWSFLNETLLQHWVGCTGLPRFCITVVAAKTTRPDILRLFLMWLYQKYGFYVPICDCSGWPQKQNHGSSEFIKQRHSEPARWCIGNSVRFAVGRPGFHSQVESYQKTLKNGVHSFPAWRSA